MVQQKRGEVQVGFDSSKPVLCAVLQQQQRLWQRRRLYSPIVADCSGSNVSSVNRRRRLLVGKQEVKFTSRYDSLLLYPFMIRLWTALPVAWLKYPPTSSLSLLITSPFTWVTHTGFRWCHRYTWARRTEVTSRLWLIKFKVLLQKPDEEARFWPLTPSRAL